MLNGLDKLHDGGLTSIPQNLSVYKVNDQKDEQIQPKNSRKHITVAIQSKV